MTLLNRLHGDFVFKRRIERLAFWLASIIPQNASVLDIGAGDGSLDSLLLKRRPDIGIEGIDVLVRPDTAIPVQKFDGRHIPFPDRSWDIALFVDVLHHAGNAADLLAEATRVSRAVIIKDHLNE